MSNMNQIKWSQTKMNFWTKIADMCVKVGRQAQQHAFKEAAKCMVFTKAYVEENVDPELQSTFGELFEQVDAGFEKLNDKME